MENKPKEKKYCRRKIKDDFLNMEEVKPKIDELKDNIMMCDERIESINDIYANICNLILSEMDKKILVKDVNTDHKRNKPKPFWSIELDNLFKAVVGKERALRKCKHRASKRGLRLDFKTAQNNFDRFYRKEKRLGPKSKKLIPYASIL